MTRGIQKLLGGACLSLVVLAGYVWYDGCRSVEAFYAAANSGDAATQDSLGVYYYQGTLFPKDYAKAMKWWQRAADQGYAEAQFNIGHMYWFGEGVPKDPVQSYMWIALAAAQNYDRAVKSLPELEKSMPPEQIAEGKRRADEWKPKPEAPEITSHQ